MTYLSFAKLFAFATDAAAPRELFGLYPMLMFRKSETSKFHTSNQCYYFKGRSSYLKQVAVNFLDLTPARLCQCAPNWVPDEMMPVAEPVWVISQLVVRPARLTAQLAAGAGPALGDVEALREALASADQADQALAKLAQPLPGQARERVRRWVAQARERAVLVYEQVSQSLTRDAERPLRVAASLLVPQIANLASGERYPRLEISYGRVDRHLATVAAEHLEKFTSGAQPLQRCRAAVAAATADRHPTLLSQIPDVAVPGGPSLTLAMTDAWRTEASRELVALFDARAAVFVEQLGQTHRTVLVLSHEPSEEAAGLLYGCARRAVTSADGSSILVYVVPAVIGRGVEFLERSSALIADAAIPEHEAGASDEELLGSEFVRVLVRLLAVGEVSGEDAAAAAAAISAPALSA